jgi:methyl-accepting chemotaxis protein
MSWRRWSLRTRIVALSTTLMGAIGVFMLVFFPNRMVAQARRSAVERGTSIATVMATALAPAVEFDDPQNANEVLAALASAGAVQFGVVRRADGTVLAAWHGEARPAETLAGGTHISGDLLTLAEPISGRAGGAGKLEVGISLAGLDRIQREATRTVAIATAIVIVVGAVASVILGSLVVGPIRRLTTTAQRISRGELPPRIPLPEGGDEVAQMAESLSVMLDRLDQANQQLLKASRHAGMAEVATGVLHNVGNVLTSVNVAVELMHERTRELPVARIRRLADHLVPTDEGGRPRRGPPGRGAALRPAPR